MKKPLLLILIFTSLSFAKSYTDTMTYTFDGIETTKSIEYVYNYNWTIHLRTKTCTTLIDTYNEEVISKKCTTKKY